MKKNYSPETYKTLSGLIFYIEKYLDKKLTKICILIVVVKVQLIVYTRNLKSNNSIFRNSMLILTEKYVTNYLFRGHCDI